MERKSDQRSGDSNSRRTYSSDSGRGGSRGSGIGDIRRGSNRGDGVEASRNNRKVQDVQRIRDIVNRLSGTIYTLKFVIFMTVDGISFVHRIV